MQPPCMTNMPGTGNSRERSRPVPTATVLRGVLITRAFQFMASRRNAGASLCKPSVIRKISSMWQGSRVVLDRCHLVIIRPPNRTQFRRRLRFFLMMRVRARRMRIHTTRCARLVVAVALYFGRHPRAGTLAPLATLPAFHRRLSNFVWSSFRKIPCGDANG